MTDAAVTAPYDLRPLLFSLAYRMTGSASEAEDLIQEAFLRHHRAVEAGEEIVSPRAWLSSVITRLSIDHLRSARARRERYVGTWLPEPLVTEPEAEAPTERAERAEAVSLALLVAMERLNPVERAVLVLRDAFDYSFAEIARIVDRSEANCRQIAVRARRAVQKGEPRFDPSPEERRALAARFLAAAREGDTGALVEMLAEDAAFYGDGGGKATAISRPVHGARAVSRLLANFARTGDRANLDIRPVEVNGQPGALVLDAEGLIVSVLALDIVDGRVQTLRGVVNPDKLDHLGEVSSWARLDR